MTNLQFTSIGNAASQPWQTNCSNPNPPYNKWYNYKVKLTPQTDPNISGSYFATGRPVFQTPENSQGEVVFTDMISGFYLVTFLDGYVTNPFYVYIPETGGQTIDASTAIVVPSGSVVPTINTAS